MRANTLKQRVSDWRPCRRWLLAEGHGCFPTDAQQVLDHLVALWESAAPRSANKSLQNALGFLEEVGERPAEERLAKEPSINNAVLQLTARRAQLRTQAELENPKAEKKAPQLLVAQRAALERTVVGAGPRYLRFLAWTKLVGHWCSLRRAL